MPSTVVMDAPIGLNREHGAAFHRHAVEIDSTCTAMAGVAADMRAGEILLFADEVDQQCARFDQRFHRLSVDRQLDMGFRHVEALPDFLVFGAGFGPFDRAAQHHARHLGR
jgi:hypothetical protein